MERKPRLFGRETGSAIILLVIQELLGMYNNLFVNFPTGGFAEYWHFAVRSVAVVAHIIVGTLGLFGAIFLLIRAIRIRDHHWITVGTIGTSAMGLAVILGALFVSTQNDIFSFFMSLVFLVAIINMCWAFFSVKYSQPAH